MDNDDNSSTKFLPKEAETSESCKQVAQDRFEDAFILYKNGRYLAAIYMAGYVIEVGIKSEFYRLAKTPLRLTNMETILRTLIPPARIQYSSDKIFKGSLIFPQTLCELLTFMGTLANIKIKKEGKDELKTDSSELRNYLIASPAYSVLFSNRAPPSEGQSFHDLSGFLTQLAEWKKLVDEDDELRVTDYTVEQWGPTLRYSIDHSNEYSAAEEHAKKALSVSFKFLKQVLRIDHDYVSTTEHKLNREGIDCE